MGIFERWRRRRSGGRDSEANALLGQRLEEDAPHDVDTQLTIGAPVHAAVAARRIADEAPESSLLALTLPSMASRATGRLRCLGGPRLALWAVRRLGIFDSRRAWVGPPARSAPTRRPRSLRHCFSSRTSGGREHPEC